MTSTSRARPLVSPSGSQIRGRISARNQCQSAISRAASSNFRLMTRLAESGPMLTP